MIVLTSSEYWWKVTARRKEYLSKLVNLMGQEVKKLTYQNILNMPFNESKISVYFKNWTFSLGNDFTQIYRNDKNVCVFIPSTKDQQCDFFYLNSKEVTYPATLGKFIEVCRFYKINLEWNL